MNNIPYTYLIGWPEHNKWYYGVRFAKNCNPNDLWVTYKTSSKYVASFVNDYGDPTVILVRKTFTAITAARNWEEKVLRRLKVITEDKWLNKSTVKAIDPACVPRGENHWTVNNPKHSDRMSNNGPMTDPTVRDKVSGKNHYTHNPEWDSSRHGMKRPEVRAKQSMSVSGENHYTHKEGYDNSNHYAKRPEARAKRAEINKKLFTGFKHRKVLCPHCQKEISANNYPQHIRKYH